MDKNKGATSGLGIAGVLTTIFVVLKLLKIIDWSWWLVLSPSLISLGVLVLAVLILILSTIVISKIKS